MTKKELEKHGWTEDLIRKSRYKLEAARIAMEKLTGNKYEWFEHGIRPVKPKPKPEGLGIG